MFKRKKYLSGTDPIDEKKELEICRDKFNLLYGLYRDLINNNRINMECDLKQIEKDFGIEGLYEDYLDDLVEEQKILDEIDPFDMPWVKIEPEPEPEKKIFKGNILKKAIYDIITENTNNGFDSNWRSILDKLIELKIVNKVDFDTKLIEWGSDMDNSITIKTFQNKISEVRKATKQ